ncbi:MAG: VWA domain-containing protein [Saprospiraceae bacterium]|nr:VWA domain-containing protein [Saprospiraceae bacterium]
MQEDLIRSASDSRSDLLKKWSLILSGNPEKDKDFEEVEWTEEEQTIDKALTWVYGSEGGSSKERNFQVNDWLKTIDFHFPGNISTIIQKDAIRKHGLKLLLQNDSMLELIVPDVQLAVTILQMKGLLPDVAKHKARLIIDALAKKLTDLFAFDTAKTIGLALRSPIINHKPKYNHINWSKTIMKNLHTFRPENKSIIPETLIGRQNRQKSIDTICILVDQSGSMYDSLIYAAIYAAIFNRIPALKTFLILFDTGVVDLTDMIDDPVDILFSTNLGGGTDIGTALEYALQVCPNPDRTLLLLISDLDETTDESKLLRVAKRAASSFRKFLTILALNKEGKGVWNTEFAEEFTRMGITCAASTPEAFPDLCAKEIVLSRVQTS